MYSPLRGQEPKSERELAHHRLGNLDALRGCPCWRLLRHKNGLHDRKFTCRIRVLRSPLRLGKRHVFEIYSQWRVACRTGPETLAMKLGSLAAHDTGWAGAAFDARNTFHAEDMSTSQVRGVRAKALPV